MKFLFVSDASVFGGHERASIDISKAMARHGTVTFAYSRSNPAFARQIARYTDWAKGIEIQARHQRAALYRAPLRFKEQEELIKLIAAESPDVIFLCQGRIETCAPQMLALKRAKIPFVSILPFAHPVQEIKKYGWSRGWENAVRYFYYRIPSAFIVPSEAARKQLLRRGVDKPIYILPNTFSPTATVHKSAGKKLLRCIGRIEFLQKRQDRLVETIARKEAAFREYRVQFVGDGPDVTKLSEMIGSSQISHIAEIVAPMSRGSVLSGTSAILMPSRFEGAPLIMLEALASRVPMVGSDIDIFRAYLPDFAISSFADPDQLVRTIETVCDTRNEGVWANLQHQVIDGHSIQRLLEAVDMMVETGLPSTQSVYSR